MAVSLQSGFPVALIDATATTTKTQSVTVNPGSNRFMLVATAHENAGGAVSGITFNGVALTKIDAVGATTWSHVEMWYLINPDVGTFNVVANKASTGGNRWGIGVYAFDGVHQTTPIKDSKVNGNDSATSSSLTLTTLVGTEFLVDILSLDSTGHLAAVGADQTQGYTGNYGNGTNETYGSRQATAGDGIMSWTWTTACPKSHMAVAISPAAEAATAAGQYGWGTYGGGDYGDNFGSSGTAHTAAATIGGTSRVGALASQFPTKTFPRGIIAVANDAFASVSISTIASRYDWCVFHSPADPQDISDRNAWKAANAASLTYAYQNWGFSADDESWTTTGFTTIPARAGGWLALFSGAEATGDAGLRATDVGKAGYGQAWANNVIARMNANPGWHGVFIDDVNVGDTRLPNGGIPDGYASDGLAYKDAAKVQLQIAVAALWGAGYYTISNVGGLADIWRGGPWTYNADLAGLTDWTFSEFGGNFSNATTEYNPVAGDSDYASQNVRAAVATAFSRGKGTIINGFGSTQALADYNDYFARIITEPGYGSVSMESETTTYLGPWPWFNPPMGAATPFVTGSVTHTDNTPFWSRALTNGFTLTADVHNMTAVMSGVVAGTATIAATGSVTASAQVVRNSAATIAGTGAVTAAGYNQKRGAATISGSGGINASGQKTLQASATVVGASSIAATGDASSSGSATINSNSAVLVSGSIGLNAASTINGQSGRAITGSVMLTGSSQPGGQGGVSAIPSIERRAASTINAVSSKNLNGQLSKLAAATTASTSTLLALTSVERRAVATALGGSALSANAQVIRGAGATIGGQSSYTANALATFGAQAALNIASTVFADGTIQGQLTAQADIAGQSSLSATANFVISANATVGGQSAVNPSAYNQKQARSNLSSTSTFAATAQVERRGATTLNSISTAQATSQGNILGAAILPSSSSASASGLRELRAATVVDGTSSATAVGRLNLLTSASPTGQSLLNASGSLGVVGEAIVQGTSSVTARPPGKPVYGFAIIRSWSTVGARVSQVRTGTAIIFGRSRATTTGTVMGIRVEVKILSRLMATPTIVTGVDRIPRRIFAGKSGIRGSRVSGGVK